MDLSETAREIRRFVQAERVLEVGCGEGALVEELVRFYPQASIVGIDITPKVGRLFRGEKTRVKFLQTTAKDLLIGGKERFDLIVLCDVIHHVPPACRNDLLATLRSLLNPLGMLAIKDWEPRSNLIHALCYFSDRIITGDRIEYLKAAALRKMLVTLFGPNSITHEAVIRPWPNNFLLVVSASPTYVSEAAEQRLRKRD